MLINAVDFSTHLLSNLSPDWHKCMSDFLETEDQSANQIASL